MKCFSYEGHQKKRPVIGCGVSSLLLNFSAVVNYSVVKMPPFFQFSADGLLVEACYRYSFGTLRKHQPFPDKKVYKNISFHHVMWIYQSCFLIMPCGFVKLFKRAIGQKRNWLWKRKRCPSSRIQCRFIWWRECHSKMITVFRFRRAQYDCISFS